MQAVSSMHSNHMLEMMPLLLLLLVNTCQSPADKECVQHLYITPTAH
jgi:hypothetical protein